MDVSVLSNNIIVNANDNNFTVQYNNIQLTTVFHARKMLFKIYHGIFQFLLLIFLVETANQEKNNTSNYGPFIISTFEVTKCQKSMKIQDATIYNFLSEKDSKGHFIVNADLIITKNIGPLMGKYLIFRWTQGRFSKLLSMNQANVCQYAFPLKVLPFTLKTDDNCIVKVAEYKNQPINVDRLAASLLGKKFFYGKFKFILEWFTKKQSAVCIEVVAELSAT